LDQKYSSVLSEEVTYMTGSTYLNDGQRDEAGQSATWLCAEKLVWKRWDVPPQFPLAVSFNGWLYVFTCCAKSNL
jgi:hypothetical protein